MNQGSDDEDSYDHTLPDERRGCRSLICDTNGIIVAEMVYRCLVCAFITESIADAQDHYHVKHTIQQKKSSSKSNDKYSVNHNAKARSKHQSDVNCDQQIYSSDPDVSHPASPTINSPSLHIDEMDMDGDDFDNFSEPDSAFGQHNSLDHFNDLKPKGKFVFSPSPADYVPGRNAMLKQNGSNLMNSNSGVRGGYVTCAVCGVTKYYASVQRRYGQFTCMGCAKFFGRFLLKPRRYYCTNLASCPLDVSPRCKACLLLACIHTYNIDEKRMRIVNANLPQSKSGTSPKSSNESGSEGGGRSKSTVSKALSSSLSNHINDSSLSFALSPLVTIHESVTDDSNIVAASSGPAAKAPTLRTTSRPAVNLPNTTSTVGRKGTGCRQCANCLADDCGKCNYCLDKPKFGGSNTLKKKCVQKKCLLIQPNTTVRVRSKAPASGLKDNNSISNTKSYVSHVK